MDTIEKTILFTPDDLQMAYTTHFSRMYPVRSRLLLLVGLVSFLVGAVLLIFQFMSGAKTTSGWASWFLLFYGVLIAILYYYNLKRIGKRMYSKMPDFRFPFSYTFSADKIVVKGENVDNSNNWEYYQSALVAPEVLMIYPNKFRFSLFPKKYFTDEEFEQLTKWISAKIKTKELKK